MTFTHQVWVNMTIEHWDKIYSDLTNTRLIQTSKSTWKKRVDLICTFGNPRP